MGSPLPLHLTVLSTVLMSLTHQLPHGKCPSKSLDPTSVVDPSSPLDSSCLPATASKTPEPPLSWEPSTLIPPDNRSTVCSNAIQATPHPTTIMITPSSPSDQMPTSPTPTSPLSLSPKKNTQVVWPLKSPDGV